LGNLNLVSNDSFNLELNNLRQDAIKLDNNRIIKMPSNFKREILNEANIKLYKSMQSRILA